MLLSDRLLRTRPHQKEKKKKGIQILKIVSNDENEKQNKMKKC
jgi:hypothetical protein